MRGRVRPPIDRTRRPGWNGQELAGFLGVRQYGGRLADRRIRSVRGWAVGRRAGAARGVIVSHTVTGVPWCMAGTPGAGARGMTPCGRAPMRVSTIVPTAPTACGARRRMRPPCGDDAWPRSRRECGRRDRAGPDRAGPDRTAGDRAEPDLAEPDRAVGTPRTRAGASSPAGGAFRGAKLSPRANSPPEQTLHRLEALRGAKLSAVRSSSPRPKPSAGKTLRRGTAFPARKARRHDRNRPPHEIIRPAALPAERRVLAVCGLPLRAIFRRRLCGLRRKTRSSEPQPAPADDQPGTPGSGVVRPPRRGGARPFRT
jgi:hypothetical protein